MNWKAALDGAFEASQQSLQDDTQKAIVETLAMLHREIVEQAYLQSGGLSVGDKAPLKWYKDGFTIVWSHPSSLRS